jgi:hypothetical protein
MAFNISTETLKYLEENRFWKKMLRTKVFEYRKSYLIGQLDFESGA